MDKLKERLYELIVDYENHLTQTYPNMTDQFRIDMTVEHLAANGVLIPPCRIGQTVYRVAKRRGVYQVLPREVMSVTYYLDYYGTASWSIFTTISDKFGKTVFLTREEAESALAERMKAT